MIDRKSEKQKSTKKFVNKRSICFLLVLSTVVVVVIIVVVTDIIASIVSDVVVVVCRFIRKASKI